MMGIEPSRPEMGSTPCLAERLRLAFLSRRRVSRCYRGTTGTEELTDGGSVHSGDEEDGSEELEGEHGDVGDVSTGWLMSSKEIRPCLYIFPASGGSLTLGLLPPHGFRNGDIDRSFVEAFRGTPSSTVFSHGFQSSPPISRSSPPVSCPSPSISRLPNSLIVSVLSVVSFLVFSPRCESNLRSQVPFFEGLRRRLRRSMSVSEVSWVTFFCHVEALKHATMFSSSPHGPAVRRRYFWNPEFT
jgi:hypothetical protein